MRKTIEDYTDPAALRTIMANATRPGDEEIWHRAFRRLCALEGLDQTDPLHRDFYETLAAYEHLLTEKNGRIIKAAGTRQKLRNKSVIQCLEDWPTGSAPIEGFDLLVRHGPTELTGEYLVLKYPDQFSAQAVDAAKTRLNGLGIISIQIQNVA